MMQQDTKGWNDLSDLEPVVTTSKVIGNNLLICDGNNLGYRYLQRKNYSNFKQDYIRTVESLAKSYSCKEVIVAFDFGKSYYRTQFYPEYKGNRTGPQTDEEKDRYEQFFNCLNDIADTIPFRVAKLRGIEADDLITYAVLRNKTEFEHIWVISSDRDIYQLLDENVSIFNVFSRKEITLSTLQETLGVTPQEYMLSRVLSGDSGDNVIGIDGIGEKRACALAKKYKILDELLKALPIKSAKSQYLKNLNAGAETLIRNEKLINLIRYNEQAIVSGKNEQLSLEEIYEISTFTT